MPLTFILVLLSVIIPVCGYLFYPVPAKAMLLDLRVLRILHYVVLAAVGICLYGKETGNNGYFLNTSSVLQFLLFSFALVYAAVFAMVTNDIADVDADRLNNPRRPFVSGAISKSMAMRVAVFCLAWSLGLSFFTGISSFYGILFISFLYYIYSCPPFRLKRIPFLSKFLIGINSLAVTICGYVLAGGTPSEFPPAWAIFILLPLSLAANFVDIRDLPGDRGTGVRTLPVVFGERSSRMLIAFFTLCAYLTGACLLDVAWLYPFNAAAALLHCLLLFRTPFYERPVFLVYLSALIALCIILLFYPVISG